MRSRKFSSSLSLRLSLRAEGRHDDKSAHPGAPRAPRQRPSRDAGDAGDSLFSSKQKRYLLHPCYFAAVLALAFGALIGQAQPGAPKVAAPAPPVESPVATGRRDLAAEMQEPGQTLRHWMDVRLKSDPKPDARYAIHVYVPEGKRFGRDTLWDNVPEVLQHCAGWTILDAEGVPLSDPVRILQVLDAAQNVCLLHRQASGPAPDRGMTARISGHVLGAAKKDHNDIWRQMLTGLAAGGPLKQAAQAWLHPTPGPGTVDKRAEAEAIEAYRTALVLVLPDLVASTSGMGGSYDALRRACVDLRPALTSSLEPPLNSHITDLERLTKVLDCKPDSPVGMSVRDGVKFDPPAGAALPPGRYWYYPYEGAGVVQPLDGSIIRAARPIRDMLPPSLTAESGLGGAALRPPGSVIQIPVQGTGRFLIPSASLNASYVDRIAAWQTRRGLVQDLKQVKAALQALEALTVASAVVRACGNRSQACLDDPNGELSALATSLSRGSAAGSDAALLAEAMRRALADVRDVDRKVAQAASDGLPAGAWAKARGEALDFLLDRVVKDPAKKLAVGSALSVGLGQGPRALGVTQTDRMLRLCLALAAIERHAVKLHNAVADDARRWSPTEPPSPEHLADALWSRRLACGAAGWFYKALFDLLSDANTLSNARARIKFPLDWASWDFMKTRAEHFAWLPAMQKDGQTELSLAGLPVAHVSESARHRSAFILKYRTYLPGTGPRLDGVWRAKAFSNQRPRGEPAGQPTAHAEVIAYLYSRPDGSFEGRMYTWWNASWPAGEVPPVNPKSGGYDGYVNIRGRCVWGGEAYFTVVDTFKSPLWVEDKGWKGHLTTDADVLAGTCAGGLPLTLRRLPEPEGPAAEAGRLEPGAPGVGMLDVVFCIDKSGSMLDDIRTIQMASAQITRELAKLAARKRISLQVGLVTFSRHDDPDWIDVWKLTPDVEEVRRNILAIRIADVRLGAGGNEDLFGAMMYAMNEPVAGKQIDMGWRRGAAKIIIPLTDEPPDEPDWEGRTLDDVARTAEELDPVHAYPLLLPKQGLAFSNPAHRAMNRIADATGGKAVKVGSASALPKEIIAAIELAVERHRLEVWRKQNPPYVMYAVMIGLGVVIVIAVLTGAIWHAGSRRQRAGEKAPAPQRRPDPGLTGESDAHSAIK